MGGESGGRAAPSRRRWRGVKALVRLRTCTVLSVPLGAYRALPAELLRCRTVRDTGDVCPSRDGRIAGLDSDEITTSELAQRLRPGALLVKAFNNILAHHIPRLVRPRGCAGAQRAAHRRRRVRREDPGRAPDRPARVRDRRCRNARRKLALRARGGRPYPDVLAVNVLRARVAADAVLPALRDGRGSLRFCGGGLAHSPSAQFASLSIGEPGIRTYAQVLHKKLAGTGVHVTSVTIAGAIGSGEARFDTAALAQAYLDPHNQPETEWQHELLRD